MCDPLDEVSLAELRLCSLCIDAAELNQAVSLTATALYAVAVFKCRLALALHDSDICCIFGHQN